MIKNWKNWLNESVVVKPKPRVLTLCPNIEKAVEAWAKENSYIESLVLEFTEDCTSEADLHNVDLITTYYEMAQGYPELIILANDINSKYSLEVEQVKSSLNLNENIENKNWYKPELKREIEKQESQNRDTIIGFVVVLILFILSLFFNDASIGIF